MAGGDKRPGDKLRIPAEEWNAMRRAAMERALPFTSLPPEADDANAVSWCWVWNNTTTDVERFGVLGVAVQSGGGGSQVALVARTTNEEEFLSRPSLIGTTPRAVGPSSHGTQFVIAMEPIPKGGYGRCAFRGGLIPVQVNFASGTTAYEHAVIKDSDFTQLQAAAHGPAEIIHKDSGSSGTIWCWVRLGNRSRPIRLGKTAASVKGWLASGNYAEADGSAYVRDTANDDFNTRESLPDAVSLGKFTADGKGLYLGDRGEWWFLPFYEKGIRCAVKGLCDLSGSSEEAGNWVTPTPALDTAELIESISSTELKLRYASSYAFKWKLMVTCDFAAISFSSPPTQSEVDNLRLRLTNWCRFEPPVASSGTLSAINGVSAYEAHNINGELALEIPISSSGRKDHFFELHAEASEGCVLAPPRFQASDGVRIDYEVIIEAIGTPYKINEA